LVSRKITDIRLSSVKKRQVTAVSRVEVVCIAKYEDPYIEEWVRYNFKLGFDHVTVYDNGLTLRWLPSRFPGQVTVVPWGGASQQIPAYNDFLARRSDEELWAAFIDIDEFIVLKRHPDIKLMISECSAGHGGALAINWVYYGSNGHLEQTYQPVTQRFTRRGLGIDPHVKCIAYIPHVASMDIHCPALKASYVQYDCDGRVFSGPFNKAGNLDIARINHYFTKSLAEFREKVARGRADTLTPRSLSEFAGADQNDVEDTSALDFLSDHTKIVF
jgi:hypothetical protein